jgi:hypothetical protein
VAVAFWSLVAKMKIRSTEIKHPRFSQGIKSY